MNRERSFDNWMYYRTHRGERQSYFIRHHMQWRGMKKFAKATNIRLPEARKFFDETLKDWYVQYGLLPGIPTQRKRRTRVWRNPDVQA